MTLNRSKLSDSILCSGTLIQTVACAVFAISLFLPAAEFNSEPDDFFLALFIESNSDDPLVITGLQCLASGSFAFFLFFQLKFLPIVAANLVFVVSVPFLWIPVRKGSYLMISRWLFGAFVAAMSSILVVDQLLIGAYFWASSFALASAGLRAKAAETDSYE